MVLYILRVILIFWIISIVVRWVGRFTGAQQGGQQAPPPTPSTADPNETPSMGKVVDAEFEDLDSGA